MLETNKMENYEKGPIKVENSNRNPSVYLGSDLIQMRIGRSLIPNPKITRAHSKAIRRTHRVSVRKGNITCRHPSGPNLERAEMPGGDSVARQRALIGNSLDDEQWSDDLYNPSSH